MAHVRLGAANSMHPLSISGAHTENIKKIVMHGVTTEVSSENNARLAVNSGEKNFFHHKAPASFSVECGEFL